MSRPARARRPALRPPAPSSVVVETVTRGGVDFEITHTHIRCTHCDTTFATGGDKARAQRFLAEHSHPTPPTSAPESSARDRLLERVSFAGRQLGRDELEVVAEVAEGLVAGRTVYGELQIDTDQRDHEREALDELRDGIVYAAVAAIQRRRRRAEAARG